MKDKQLDFYSITVKVEIFYHLQLLRSMKHIHSVFSSKYLWSSLNNSLSKQHSELSRLMIIEKNEEHWEVDNILNFRRYKERLQYKVKWIEINRDDKWYYVDKEKFDDSKKVLNKFHKLYLNKLHQIENTMNFFAFISFLFMWTWMFKEEDNVMNMSESIRIQI